MSHDALCTCSQKVISFMVYETNHRKEGVGFQMGLDFNQCIDRDSDMSYRCMLYKDQRVHYTGKLPRAP